jgi:hypothetical protein
VMINLAPSTMRMRLISQTTIIMIHDGPRRMPRANGRFGEKSLPVMFNENELFSN